MPKFNLFVFYAVIPKNKTTNYIYNINYFWWGGGMSHKSDASQSSYDEITVLNNQCLYERNIGNEGYVLSRLWKNIKCRQHEGIQDY